MADAPRKIARAYIERASEEEKNEVKQYFSEVDKNGDGKVTLTELKSRYFRDWVHLDTYFKYLDSDGDGVLGFSDVQELYYIEKRKVYTGTMCDGCGEYVAFVDPSFSCFLCLPKYPKTYDLCFDCYGRGKFDHCHPLTNFIHNQTHMGCVLKHHQEKTTRPTLDSERASEEEKSEAKRVQIKTEMADATRKIARAYYERASEEEKNVLKEFFNLLDMNGDGKVTITEFKSQTGSSSDTEAELLELDEFFKHLDSDGDGVLGFSDFLPLFYYAADKLTIWIRCDGCGDLQVFCAPYFSCVLCLPKWPQTYDLCCDCYGRGKFDHCHPLTNFMHNQIHMGSVLNHHQENTTQPTLFLFQISPQLYSERAREEENDEWLRVYMKNKKIAERGKLIADIASAIGDVTCKVIKANSGPAMTQINGVWTSNTAFNQITSNMQMNGATSSAINQIGMNMMNGASNCTIL